MARSTTPGSAMPRLRSLWFQIHKWIGVVLALLIIPISLSGAALVWNDALDAVLNPGRYAVTSSQARLSPGAYAASARSALAPGETIFSLRYPEGGGPIVVTAAQPARAEAGRPVRTSLWLDPVTGRVLDRANSNEGAVRVLHGLHGSLMMPGVGRQIVGWVGVAMLFSSLTGLWLWWPVTGSLRRGFRWRRQNSFNANLHHQMGFWIMLPLAMLSFTGAWISFPAFFGQFEASQPRAKVGAGLDKAAAMRARPLASPASSPDSAVAAARPFAAGGPLSQISWPTDHSPKWKIAFA
ncbi:MAG: PepSY-associated TM helix domain-containing protein, partial [Allosphingosinicella sp.]